MNQVDEMRMDKWLFAVRLFKTRGQAADACRGGKITLNDTAVKAAKTVRVGDTVSVRQSPMVRSFKVIGLTERRVGAKLVENFAEDITPKSEWAKLRNAKREGSDTRNKAQGRPSKRERRLIDQFMELGGNT